MVAAAPDSEIPAPSGAELPQTMQLINVGLALKLAMPPPRRFALLPTKVQLISAGLEAWFVIPPPFPAGPINQPSTELPAKTQLTTVGLPPKLYITPAP